MIGNVGWSTPGKSPSRPGESLKEKGQAPSRKEETRDRKKQGGEWLDHEATENQQNAPAERPDGKQDQQPVAIEPPGCAMVLSRLERPTEETSVTTEKAPLSLFGGKLFLGRGFHEVGAQRGVENERHQQRGRQADDERHR